MILLRILFRYGGWRLGVSAVAGLVGGAALAGIMRLVHVGLDIEPSAAGQALLQGCGLVGIYLVTCLLSGRLLDVASEDLQAEMRQALVRQTLSLPLRRVEKLGTARFFNMVTEDVGSVSMFVCRMPEVFVNFAVAAGCLAYMAWLSPFIFLFNVAFLAVAAVCYKIPEGTSQRTQRRAATTWDGLSAQIHFSLNSLRTLLLSRRQREDLLRGHFEPSLAEFRRLTLKVRFYHLFAERFAEAMVLTNIVFLLFVFPRFIPLGRSTVAGLLIAAIFARGPLKDLLGAMPRASRARTALERIEECGLRLEGDAATAADKVGPVTVFRDLVLEGVHFSYEDDHDQKGFSAGPLSLRIAAGETVFIVGGNGVGKTTVAKLICGLYPATSGSIRIDGNAVIGDEGTAAHRALFSAVFLEDPLFPHILGVESDEAQQRGKELLDRLHMGHKVTVEGTRFSTTDLSQGQRRRLLLLSALIQERPILLLDEWASDQDSTFRAFFYDNLLPYIRSRGTTVILITHDDRYFDRADRILRLESGKLSDVNLGVPTGPGSGEPQQH